MKVTNMLESFQVTHICGLLSILIGKYRVYIKVPFLLNFGGKIFLGKGFFSFGNIFENFFFWKNLLIFWIFVDKYSNFCSNYSAEYLAKTECTFGRIIRPNSSAEPSAEAPLTILLPLREVAGSFKKDIFSCRIADIVKKLVL